MNWYFASGDLGFFWEEQIQAFSWLPEVFHPEYGHGFNGLLSLWLDYPFRLVVKLLATAGLSWFVIEKLLWISVFALAIYSSYRLTKHWLGSLIYTFNTYFLLLFSGGQLGVAYAYAFAPFIFYRFMKYPTKGIINGLYLAILLMFDIRIAFLVLLATIPWWYRSLISPFVAASVHLYWILPTVFARVTVPGELTNPGMLEFLSFSDFSHALGFLHPNWPENMFGKVYFMQPEFLILPLLAFGSLLWRGQETMNNKQRRLLLTVYCPFLVLVGAFFAKGVNEPFGQLFNWMFTHVPGFVLFRDPTKFYLYIALGYSVLIPFVLQKFRKPVITVLFIVFWIVTLRAVQIPTAELPQEYRELKHILVADTVPSRTLWIPQKESFAFYSDTHPILTATSATSVDPSIKYVIVPIDVNRRIFLADYKFDPSIRENVISSISFPRNSQFRDLAVFENPQFSKMESTVAEIAVRQQQLANMGLGISIGFLAIWILWIFLR